MNHLNINSEKVEVAIADFESSVDFELVPVITQSSTPTAHVKWMLIVLMMLIAICKIEIIHVMHWYELTVADTIYYFGAAFIVSVFLGFFLSGFEIVQRAFTFKKMRDAEVQQTAEQIFLKKRLFETKSNQGLLLFVSLMEHRIVLLPDARSDFKGSHELTQEVLKILQVSFKSNDFENGILNAIKYLKGQLVEKFPQKTDVTTQNQIPNKLIWWDE